MPIDQRQIGKPTDRIRVAVGDPVISVERPISLWILGIGVHDLIEAIAHGPGGILGRRELSWVDGWELNIRVRCVGLASGIGIQEPDCAMSRKVEPVRPQSPETAPPESDTRWPAGRECDGPAVLRDDVLR